MKKDIYYTIDFQINGCIHSVKVKDLHSSLTIMKRIYDQIESINVHFNENEQINLVSNLTPLPITENDEWVKEL